MAEGQTPEVSATRSNALAEGWRVTFGIFAQDFLSSQRGESVDVEQLRLCDTRPLYARRAYEEIDTSVVLPVRRPFAPFWLHFFCDPKGTPVVTLAASAYNTDVVLEDGKVRLAPLQGGEFQSSGIPRIIRRRPVSPERAVELVFGMTRTRIIAVPELHLPARPLPQYESRWRILLESPIRVLTGAADTLMTSELWIGSSTPSVEAEVAIRGSSLPSVTVTYSFIDGDGQLRTREFTALPREGRTHWVPSVPVGAPQ